MHGLIGKAIQSFLCDSHGQAVWEDVALQSGVSLQLGPDGFEAMQLYDRALLEAVLATAVQRLATPRDLLLEDLGTYLISHERHTPLRRLLRFGGVSFTDFLYSLDDLQGRTQLAVPELELPELTIGDEGPGRFVLTCRKCPPGFGHLMVGILRAMADDYGALAVLEHCGSKPTVSTRAGRDTPACDERIMIDLYDPTYHAGRRFDLAVPEPS